MIKLYEALLREAEGLGVDAVALLNSRRRETIEHLLERRLREHRTGRFTPGANRAARTLFNMIVWNLKTPNGCEVGFKPPV